MAPQLLQIQVSQQRDLIPRCTLISLSATMMQVGLWWSSERTSFQRRLKTFELFVLTVSCNSCMISLLFCSDMHAEVMICFSTVLTASFTYRIRLRLQRIHISSNYSRIHVPGEHTIIHVECILTLFISFSSQSWLSFKFCYIFTLGRCKYSIEFAIYIFFSYYFCIVT